ncbi:FUSC family protein [Streptomyces boninensis]|uniref:FUSC family protein n=1 Tax=Streptomyces boninensis TaxID=2039455 RepID=UPI003B21E19E
MTPAPRTPGRTPARTHARSWTRAVRDAARAGVSVERASLTPLIAMRGACGVGLILAGALWLGSPALAVSSAFGAFASGVASFQRSWRPRPALALGAAAGLSFSSFCGYLAAGHPAPFVVLLAVWAFGAGMAWAVGQVSGVVSALTVAAMLVVVTLPTSVAQAAMHAGIIALGGLLQAALIVIFPVRPWGNRRDALADALAAVADYARRLREDPDAPFDPQPLMEAREAAAVTPRQARRRPRQLHGYRTLAESIRPVLASLADPVVGAAPEGPERDRVRELLAASATVLDATARAVRRGEAVRLPEQALEVLKVPEAGPALPPGPARKAALRLLALSDEVVEAAQEPVEVTSSRTGAGAAHPHLRRPSGPGLLRVALRAVRRELRWSSPVFRHAVRLSAVVAVAYLLGEALPPTHGYWIALTVVMVLRPDFSQTYERGAARLAGTITGVAIAGGVLALIAVGPWLSALFAVLSVALLYLLMPLGYAAVSACTGAYVVFLLGIVGEDWAQTVWERIALTLIGGVLATVSYALFPAWESPWLRDRLASWLTANNHYAAAVFTANAVEPSADLQRDVRQALLDARAARMEWEQATARAAAEPVRHRGMSRRKSAEAQDAQVTIGRLAMLLEAHTPNGPAEPEAQDFAAALADASVDAAAAVREKRPLDWTPVHAALARWQRETSRPAGVALRVADLITDALDELAAAVG